MNHLLRIFSTAQAFQATRSASRSPRPNVVAKACQDFGEAIGNAILQSVPPEAIVEEVAKAMGGDQELALGLMREAETVAKAVAEAGEVEEKPYEVARGDAMKATGDAYSATLRANQTGSAEGHENAAASHRVAAERQKEASEAHPDGIHAEHAGLHTQHLQSEAFHRQKAKEVRDGEVYDRAKGKAESASTSAMGPAESPREAVLAHRHAASMHRKAEEARAGEGHEDKAMQHEAQADALEAQQMAVGSPHAYKAKQEVQGGIEASKAALGATEKAHKTGKPEDHNLAAAAHGVAAERHTGIHATQEGDEEKGHHALVAQKHTQLHAYHTQAAAPEKGEEVAKAMVDAYTYTTANGKVVHVASYERAKLMADELKRGNLGKGMDKDRLMSAMASSNAAHRKGAQLHPTAHQEAMYDHQAAANQAEDPTHKAFHAGMALHHAEQQAQVTATRAKAISARHQDHHPDAKKAHDLTREAEIGTAQAHDFRVDGGRGPKHSYAASNHAEAAKAHAKVADVLRADGPKSQEAMEGHTTVSKMHEKLADYHSKAASAGGEDVTKGEGPMTSMGGGTDLATKTGGSALAVEGRPGEKQAKHDEAIAQEELAKGHVEGYNRESHGRVTHVDPYERMLQHAHKGSPDAQSKTNRRSADLVKAAHSIALQSTDKQDKALAARDMSYAAHIKTLRWGKHEEAAEAHDAAAKAHRSVGSKANDALAVEHEGIAESHRIHKDATIPAESLDDLRARPHTAWTTIKNHPDLPGHYEDQDGRQGGRMIAAMVSEAAKITGDPKHHRHAAEMNRRASEMAKKAGDKVSADIHRGIADEHDAHAQDVAKAHHEASTREVNGKVVQVAAYDDARQAAQAHQEKAGEAFHPMPRHAHEASANAYFAQHKAQTEGGTANHMQAMKLHQQAGQAHEEAAGHAWDPQTKQTHMAHAEEHFSRSKAHEEDATTEARTKSGAAQGASARTFQNNDAATHQEAHDKHKDAAATHRAIAEAGGEHAGWHEKQAKLHETSAKAHMKAVKEHGKASKSPSHADIIERSRKISKETARNPAAGSDIYVAKAGGASDHAAQASEHAERWGHDEAMRAHQNAAKAHRMAHENDTAGNHKAHAEAHDEMAKWHEGKVAK